MPRRGYSCADLLAVVVCAALALVILLIAGARQRQLGSLAESRANLQRFGGATLSFANDNADSLWGFTWKKMQQNSTYPDLNNAPTDLQAHADQAVDIIRRRMFPTMPKMVNWVPDLLYSQLVLAEYLDLSIPDRWFASPADATLLLWQDDPAKVPPGGSDMQRWRASSSYEMPPAFFSSPSSGPTAISQSSTHNAYVVPSGTAFGPHKLSEVVHPSQKVFFHDRYQRHFGSRIAFFGYKEARVLMLAVDGAVEVRKSSTVNRGWNPLSPTSPSPSFYSYSPATWEPPILPGTSTSVEGHYRWTRKALEGRDFGGSDL